MNVNLGRGQLMKEKRKQLPPTAEAVAGAKD
jgi:hypothetical protein